MKFLTWTVLAVCLCAPSAAASVIIDQEHVSNAVGYILDYPGDYMAQTFTARNTGQITSIGLQLSIWSYRPSRESITDDLHLQLTRTNAIGEPVVDEVLATYSISPFEVTLDWSGLPIVDFDLRTQQVHVNAGEVLAIVLSSNYTFYSHSDRQDYVWATTLWSDAISGGKFFVYSTKVFGPRWFYQWNLKDPTLTCDAGYRITIDAVPEPSTAFLAVLGICAFCGLIRRSQ